MLGEPAETTELRADATSADEPASPRWWPRLVVWTALAAALVVLVAWQGVAAHQRAQVQVWFDAQPVECRSGTPPVIDLEQGWGAESLYVPVLDADADLDCWLRVRVENRGRLTARLDGLVLPFYGPGTGAAVHAGELSPLGLLPVETHEGGPARDAMYRFEYPLLPDETVVLRIHLRYAPDGCKGPDSLTWLQDEPTVSLSVLGLMGERHPTGTVFAQRGTRDSRC